MGTGVTGNKVAVGAYTEATYKNAGGTPDGMKLLFSKFGLAPSQARDKSEVINGTLRGPARSVPGQRTVGGNIETELGPESIGWFLKHMVGKPTSAVAGSANKHTFQVAASPHDLPAGMTFEVDYSAALTAPGRYMRYSGCRIAKGTFTFKPSGMIAASFQVIGADFNNAATTPLDATLTDLGHTSFYALSAAIVLSNGSSIGVSLSELVLNWNNDLDESMFFIGGNGARDSLPEGEALVDGTVTALFEDGALLQQVQADTDCSLVITISRGAGDGTAGNEKLVITVPAFVFAPSAPPINGPKGMTFQANWTAHRTSGEIGAKFELYNMQAAIY